MSTTRKKKTSSVKVKPKSAPKVVVAPTLVTTEPAPAEIVEKSPELKAKELVERVIAKNGMKRKDVKPVVETVLAVLGEAIANEETLNLQPMGRFVIKRTKDLPNAKVTTCRIRQSKKVETTS